MVAVGIDTHKDSLAACVVDELGDPLAQRIFGNDHLAHEALLAWIQGAAGNATIGIEGSAMYGAAAARFLLHAGARVREVPPQLTHRERGRTRRPGKSDPGDALAIARIAARERSLPPVRLSDRTVDIRMLVEAREDAVAEAVRVRNQLHADLVILVPGYSASVANRGGNRQLNRAFPHDRHGPGGLIPACPGIPGSKSSRAQVGPGRNPSAEATARTVSVPASRSWRSRSQRGGLTR